MTGITKVDLLTADDGGRYWRVDVLNLTAAELPDLVECLDQMIVEVDKATERFVDPQWRDGFYAGVMAGRR